MSVGHVPPVAPTSSHPGSDAFLGRWAVLLALVVVAVVVVSYAIFGVAWAIGGEDAVSDTWVGMLGGIALLGGMATSIVAFVMAVVAKVRHVQRALLWVPLTVFPALAIMTVLAEWLWME